MFSKAESEELENLDLKGDHLESDSEDNEPRPPDYDSVIYS